MKLFLDDYRHPIDCASYMYQRRTDCRIYHEEWTVARSYLQFIRCIMENGIPEYISFDYDLADVFELREELDIIEWFNLDENRVYTGLDCVKWLINYCRENNLELPKYSIHSSNPDGYNLIKNELDSFNNKPD